MIDPQHGRITFDTVVVEPNLTEAEFVQQRPDATVFVENPPFRSFRVVAEPWTVILFFRTATLESVSLSHHLDADALGWGGWSEENERRRKDLHDGFLREWLGSAPLSARECKFPWGVVSSVIDLKGGDASIFVSYGGAYRQRLA